MLLIFNCFKTKNLRIRLKKMQQIWKITRNAQIHGRCQTRIVQSLLELALKWNRANWTRTAIFKEWNHTRTQLQKKMKRSWTERNPGSQSQNPKLTWTLMYSWGDCQNTMLKQLLWLWVWQLFLQMYFIRCPKILEWQQKNKCQFPKTVDIVRSCYSFLSVVTSFKRHLQQFRALHVTI